MLVCLRVAKLTTRCQQNRLAARVVSTLIQGQRWRGAGACVCSLLWLCTKALLSKFEKFKPAEGPLDATIIVLWIRMRMQCTGVCLCEDTPTSHSREPHGCARRCASATLPSARGDVHQHW
jgi:hypothetical protein